MLQRLREQVLEANLEFVRRGLVRYFDNVSGISPEQRWVMTKASGVPYEQMKPAHLVVVDPSPGVLVANHGPFNWTVSRRTHSKQGPRE